MKIISKVASSGASNIPLAGTALMNITWSHSTFNTCSLTLKTKLANEYVICSVLWSPAKKLVECRLTVASFKRGCFHTRVFLPILEGGAPSTWVDPAGSPAANQPCSRTANSGNRWPPMSATEQRWLSSYKASGCYRSLTYNTKFATSSIVYKERKNKSSSHVRRFFVSINTYKW